MTSPPRQQHWLPGMPSIMASVTCFRPAAGTPGLTLSISCSFTTAVCLFLLLLCLNIVSLIFIPLNSSAWISCSIHYTVMNAPYLCLISPLLSLCLPSFMSFCFHLQPVMSCFNLLSWSSFPLALTYLVSKIVFFTTVIYFLQYADVWDAREEGALRCNWSGSIR